MAFNPGGNGDDDEPVMADINVTPLVDVMLVLLIIFMISAPLLTVGVPLQLPKTEAGAMQDQNEPLTVSIRADGQVFLNQTQVQFSALSPALTSKKLVPRKSKMPAVT